MSDNEIVQEVEYVAVSLRVVKREQMPSTPKAVMALLQKWCLYDRSQESVWVLSFDSQGFLRKIGEVARGSYGSVDVPIAAVMSAVHLAAADRFWLVHNHPGGSASPSREDIDLTEKVLKAANLSGLRMEDHVILAPPNNSFSFRDARLIQDAEEDMTEAAANELVIQPVTFVEKNRVSVQENP